MSLRDRLRASVARGTPYALQPATETQVETTSHATVSQRLSKSPKESGQDCATVSATPMQPPQERYATSSPKSAHPSCTVRNQVAIVSSVPESVWSGMTLEECKEDLLLGVERAVVHGAIDEDDGVNAKVSIGSTRDESLVDEWRYLITCCVRANYERN